jgi:hypothetical protein
MTALSTPFSVTQSRVGAYADAGVAQAEHMVTMSKGICSVTAVSRPQFDIV